MFYLVFVLLLFVASVFTHIYFCRTAVKPGLHAKAFVFIALISLSFYAAVNLLFSPSGRLDPHSLWGMPFKITAGIIFIFLVPIYLCFYVLTQLTSPSKMILADIAKRGDLSYNELLSSVQKEGFISSRLKDLVSSGCVIEKDGRYSLTADGQKIALILNVMKCILGRDAGG